VGFKVERERGDGVERSYLGACRCSGFRYSNGKDGGDAKEHVTRARGSRKVQQRFRTNGMQDQMLVIVLNLMKG